MDKKRVAEGELATEPPTKQQRIDDILTQPPSDYPEPSDLDMIDNGRVAVFQRAQLWAKVADLNTQNASLTARNKQLEEHIAGLNHVPRAAVYHLRAVEEDLELTLQRAGITIPADVEKSPVSAAVLDPEVNASDLFASMEAPIKPIKSLVAQIIWALEQKKFEVTEQTETDKIMAELHAKVRRTSDDLQRFSEREEQLASSLSSTQSDLEDARQNLETMRKHIVSLELEAQSRQQQQEEEQQQGVSTGSDAEEAVANGPIDGNKEPVLLDGASKDGIRGKRKGSPSVDPKIVEELEEVRELLKQREKEISVHIEEKKNLRVERERLIEDAEIREGGVVEMNEVLGSALYQTMEMKLQDLYLKHQDWEREKVQIEKDMKTKQKAFEEELQELKSDYEDRIKSLKQNVEEMRAEKDKAKADKDKWSMTYEARKLEQSKGRVIAACEARTELAEKLRDKSQEENKKLREQIADLEKKLSDANELVRKNSKLTNDEAISKLKADLESEKAKCDGFMAEIESTVAMCSDVEAENGRLTNLLAEKEQILSRIMGERLKHRQALTTVKEENRTLLTKLSMESDKLKVLTTSVSATKKELADAKLLSQKADEEASLAKMEADRRKRLCDELTERSRTAAAEKNEVKLQLESIKERASKAVAEIEEVRHELRRKKEDLSKAQVRLTKLENEEREISKMNGEDVRDELIAEMRSRLNCSVITTQPKEVVLLRCGHLFSRQCVDELVAGRNRKCPICGERFGQDDVRPIFFT